MKGYFSINYDYTTEDLQFCNLDPEVHSLGSLDDSCSPYSSVGKLIAHDVVEHSLNHRRKKYVTFEDELKAVGATQFVRMGEFDLYRDLLVQCDYIVNSARELKPVPYIVGEYLLNNNQVNAETIRHLIQNGVSPEVARKAVFHCEWGYALKEWQYKGHHGAAYSDFHFIEYNIPTALRTLRWEAEYATGVSVYFDTDKQIFRHQLKRRFS